MDDNLKIKLKEKGWSEEEINNASNLMQGADSEKRSHKIAESPIVYWMALLVAIVGNLIISVVLVPFIIVLKGPVLYLMIIVLAMLFGTLFNILLRDIESMDKEHHVIASVFIPALALINIYLVVSMTKPIKEIITGSPLVESPWMISLVYVLAFVLPYALHKAYDRAKRKAL